MKSRTFYLIVLLLGSLIILSCSPQRRLNRLVALHPELKTSDTLLLRDTVILPLVQSDTFFHIDSLFDTVIIEKDRLQMSLLRLHDTLYLQGKCDPDTIIVEKKIPVERITSVKSSRIDKIIALLPWLGIVTK